jgi:hypothetical protein
VLNWWLKEKVIIAYFNAVTHMLGKTKISLSKSLFDIKRENA